MKRAGLLAVLALLLLQVGAASAQTSDYEIIEAFKKSYQSLLGAVKAAQSPAECVTLEGQVGRLEADYQQHRKLLAEGLYPETFDAAIATLREQLKKSTERVSLIEERKQDKAVIEVVSKKAETAEKKVVEVTRQNEEFKAAIDKLNLELKDLTGRLQKLTDENTGLLAQVKALQQENRQDKESIAKLQALTEKLNANIRDRDDLIVKMMDSLFNEYSKAGLTDVQKQNLFVNAQGNDYVGKIVATVDGNIKYAQSALLSPQDLKQARDEHQKLAAKWETIKPQVAKLYPDTQIRTRDITTVDSRITDWKRSIDAAAWKSIQQVFAGQNINVGPFQNGAEFHTRVLAYLDAQLKQPTRDAYNTFKRKAWDSPIKDQWLPLIPADDLTAQQRADIEERITRWDKEIAAIALRRTLIGVGVAALVALIVVVAMISLKKKKPTPAA